MEYSDSQITIAQKEAQRKLLYNLLWYKLQKQITSSTLGGNLILNRNNIIELLKKRQNKCIEKLRFTTPISFLLFEGLTLTPPTIQGLEDHYNTSISCRPRLDFLDQHLGWKNANKDTKLVDYAISDEVIEICSQSEFMEMWKQYELADKPKWESYTHS